MLTLSCLFRTTKSHNMTKGPETIGNILSEMMARRGLGRIQSTEALETVWRQVAGPLVAQYTRIGAIRRGTLEINVANSTLIQELSFQKHDLLAALQKSLPEEGIKNLRFRVGSLY
jgi:predicted nucleic acid-binding Zn ribbon protein